MRLHGLGEGRWMHMGQIQEDPMVCEPLDVLAAVRTEPGSGVEPER